MGSGDARGTLPGPIRRLAVPDAESSVGAKAFRVLRKAWVCTGTIKLLLRHPDRPIHPGHRLRKLEILSSVANNIPLTTCFTYNKQRIG